MPRLHLHGPPKFRCPYEGCHKSFEKPTVLTDPSTTPRKSFYACPHCMSKLDIRVDNMKITEINTVEYGRVLDSPAKCAHYSGFVSAISKDISIPDDCLVCPKILQCSIRRE